MTVAETARKQGKAVLRFLIDRVTADLNGRTPPRLVGAPDAA